LAAVRSRDKPRLQERLRSDPLARRGQRDRPLRRAVENGDVAGVVTVEATPRGGQNRYPRAVRHGRSRGYSFFTGQTPVLKYNRALMMAILHDRIHIAKAVNATVIPLDSAPKGYAEFNKGVARKFVIDPHGSLKGTA
jgi:threonine dehydrogenase-like Zn-dependent dehydrogenase